MTNVAVARATASGSVSRPPKSSPAKTRRFFVHCSGRSETRRKVRLDVSRRGEASDSIRLVVVRLEDGQQFGDREQVRDPLRQAEELEAAALAADGGVGPDDLAEAGAVDVRNGFQVEHQLLASLEHQAVDFVLE